jgi:hypothetical protein
MLGEYWLYMEELVSLRESSDHRGGRVRTHSLSEGYEPTVDTWEPIEWSGAFVGHRFWALREETSAWYTRGISASEGGQTSCIEMTSAEADLMWRWLDCAKSGTNRSGRSG